MCIRDRPRGAGPPEICVCVYAADLSLHRPLPGDTEMCIRDSLFSYPYQMLFPAFAISITIFALNFIGDGLRDALDPRLKK